LREGLDLPEVSLVAILDADKEGFLRSERSLIQTIGRAARNVYGRVIMYADTVTSSMSAAINETNRRRYLQMEYNQQHQITPQSIQKGIRDTIEATKPVDTDSSTIANIDPLDTVLLIDTLTHEMQDAAKNLNFEKAALLRDKIRQLQGQSHKPDPT